MEHPFGTKLSSYITLDPNIIKIILLALKVTLKHGQRFSKFLPILSLLKDWGKRTTNMISLTTTTTTTAHQCI